MPVQHPHDHFFRESFGRLEIARNYLEEYLPGTVRRLLDLETLILQDGSFVDEALQTHQSDLLYQVRLHSGDPAFVYFLFEHKSYPEPKVGLQLLRYMVRVWERLEKEQQPLAPIVPLLIYHGEQPWRGSTTFSDLFVLPAELRPFTPDFRFHMSDFSHLSDETIRGRIWLRVSLAVMRSIFDPDLRSELDSLVRLMFALSDKRTGLEYIHTILYYLSRATDRVDMETLRRALLQQGEIGEQAMSTIAETLISQGIEQGIEQSIMRVLSRRFGDIPADVQSRLVGLSAPLLADMLDEALVAPDVDTFAARLPKRD